MSRGAIRQSSQAASSETQRRSARPVFLSVAEEDPRGRPVGRLVGLAPPVVRKALARRAGTARRVGRLEISLRAWLRTLERPDQAVDVGLEGFLVRSHPLPVR